MIQSGGFVKFLADEVKAQFLQHTAGSNIVRIVTGKEFFDFQRVKGIADDLRSGFDGVALPPKGRTQM